MIQLFSAVKANADVNFSIPIQRVLDRHWYVLGEEVTGFEKEFSAYIGVTDCISVANGTDALELALRGLGVQKNDEVVTVANAGFYSSTAIHAIGAIPIYADVENVRLTMSTVSLAKALERKPKAVVVTHLYGQIANITELVEHCRKAGVALLEDCAQAHGASYMGKLAGSFGDASCFSFYPTKNLGALGDGGAVLTDNSDVAARVRKLRQYGWSEKYHVALPGGRNSRLDEIQAAILREKLPYLTLWNSKRRSIAKRYNEAFTSLPIQCPVSVMNDYVAHLYVIQVENRTKFRQFLKDNDIMTDIHYPIPDHFQPAYPHTEVVEPLRVTEAICNTVLSLPCYPGLIDSDVERVIKVVKDFF